MAKRHGFIKKALIFQSLFFCICLQAQQIRIQQPQEGQPLLDTQPFLITIEDGVATRVEFHLNGRLLRARTQAPWQFEVRWNTKITNKVRILAWIEGRDQPLVLEKTYREIRVDLQQELNAFHCFPFLDRSLPAQWRFRSNNKDITPQELTSADKFPLDLIVLIDISGSMKFVLPDQTAFFSTFKTFAEQKRYRVRYVVFDSGPRLLSSAPTTLDGLYQGEPKSVVWDAVATAAGLFDNNPRRLILLISDGADDGSRHDAGSVANWLKRGNIPLIWLNPTDVGNRDLSRLARKSGGFNFYSSGQKQWETLITRLTHQVYLLAPDATYPIRFDISPGRVWLPDWEQ